jgi:DNA-binding CsgD family transcriptional regulator
MESTGRSNQLGLAACAATTEAVVRALSTAGDRTDLAALMEGITHELGFRHYALIHHDDLRCDPTNRVKLLSYPAAIEDRIIGQATWRRDPVIRGCLFSERAFRWSELPNIIRLDRRDEQCLSAGVRSGLSEGITVPYLLLGECTGSCTFAGVRAPRRAARSLGMAQMVGVFAFQAARRILTLPATSPAPRPRLHPRVRDCVVLCGRGLSNKEIARALGLTPRTVDSYLREARRLFDAHDRTELLVAAMLAGEIELHEVRRVNPRNCAA